jgi:serine/threonine-protein kinase
VTSIPSPIGQRIGNFEIQSVLGSGGMATVYQGFDYNLQRPVAIKMLTDAVASQPDIVERFQREARVVARLHHPHIVQVYDFGETQGRAYMVQELLPGPTLAQQLNTWQTHGIQPARDDVLAIVQQVAAGLDAAHAAGVLHRDVKPSNIIRNASGTWVLTDFGIAKHMHDNAALTQTGVVVGTPAYLSPEQAQGQPLAPASDLYSFGVVVYEMLAGQPPFSSATSMGVLLDHIQTPPAPIRQFRPDLPPAVETIIQRALAKKPEDRPASAGEFAQALERAWQPGATTANIAVPAEVHSLPTAHWAQAQRPAPAEPAIVQPLPQEQTTSRRTHWWMPIVLGLAGLLLVGALFVLLRNEFEPGEPPAASATNTLPIAVEATSMPTPSATPQPTAQQNAAAPAAPTSTTPNLSGSLAQLQALLETGIADGSAGSNGAALLQTFDQVVQALGMHTQQGVNSARIQLVLMQQHIAHDVSSGSMTTNFAQSVLAGIDHVSKEYGLRLPSVTVQSSGNSDNGKENPGKGKDKGDNPNPHKGKND